MFFLRVSVSLTGAFLLMSGGLAQTQKPLRQADVPVLLDSGMVISRDNSWQVAFSEILRVPDAPWIRLQFEEAELGQSPEGESALLRITSVQDGASQVMNATHLEQWRNSSAYFNGDEVVVEILASPEMAPSHLRIEKATVGLRPEGSFLSICGPTDDRELSTDDRQGRLVPVLCTGWMINDQFNCFLTAGHCSDGTEVVEFNVPLSLSDGSVQHPPPEDQYAVDPFSMQSNGGQGIGNDWAYFGAFPNTNTGLTPFEAQGASYILGPPPAGPSDQNIRITGYGSTDGVLAPLEWRSVQKTHVGPLISITATTLNYQTDTTGGNSGSPIFHEESGTAIGIHTHAGCNAVSGNNGTNILFGPLQNALANPQGICKPPALLDFTFPDGIPELFSPNGQVFRVQVSGVNGGVPQSGTGMLHYDLEDGQGVQSVAMIEESANVYFASFPAVACGSRVIYSFSAQTSAGTPVGSLEDNPNLRSIAEAGVNLNAGFADHFETDMGWTVENSPGLTAGAWERGVPAGAGLRQDPLFDGDGSGQCFLTENVPFNSDVDGGNTVLVSPVMDATQGDAYISYRRWFSNQSEDDVMVVEVSNNGGADWQVLETVGPTGPEVEGGWIMKSFRVAGIFAQTDQFRIRFDVSDTGVGSIVEAGIDDVRMNRSELGILCQVCLGDLNNDGVVDMDDVGILIAAWGTTANIDLNGDSQLDIADIMVGLEALGDCN